MRFRPNEDFGDTCRYVEHAEKLGFDSVAVSEGHFGLQDVPGVSEFLNPRPLTTLAWIAGRTSTINLVFAVALLPFYHPVSFAGELSTLDHISHGRVILGAGAGWMQQDFESFGLKYEERFRRLEESISIMKLLWSSSSVSYSGSYHDFKDFSLPIKPFRRNHIPIWSGGYGSYAVKRAARLGDSWLPGATVSFSDYEELMGEYKHLLQKEGKQFGEQANPIIRICAARNTSDEARADVERFYLPFITGRVKQGHPGSESTNHVGVEEVADKIIFGDPSKCIEQIEEYRRLGANEIILDTNLTEASSRDGIRNLSLFAEKVMGHYRD